MKLISLPKLPSSIRSIEALDCPSLKAVTNLLKPNSLNLADCMKPISLPKLPSSIRSIEAFDCPSLKAVTNLLEPNSLCEPRLLLSNRCRLANNQGIIVNMFFAVIRKHHQGPCFGYEVGYAYDLIIPGNIIPRWFSHQTTGTKISIKVPCHLRDEWMGIAVCVVFVSTPPYNTNPIDRCSIFIFLTANGKNVRERVFRPGGIFMMDHIKLSYLLPELFDKEAMEQLWQCDVNGFSHIGIQISTQNIGLEVRSFGFRMVYKKDMEDLNQTMAQCANNSITPYQGLDVIRHNFDNSVISEEGKKVKRSRDDYDGAGPSGEGSSNNVPHPKRIERVPEFLAHGISDCDESSDSD
nr:inactive disease resistance protein rps4 [Quercus suber]